MYKRVFAACLAVFLFISVATAQKAEVTISLNEAFFDALLDSVFQNFGAPEFPIAQNALSEPPLVRGRNEHDNKILSWVASGPHVYAGGSDSFSGKSPVCSESVKILREINGVRTAVRFREGKIFVPLAFSGNYAPPFIGCVEFAGWAETNIDLEFDQNTQRLTGRAKVLNVNLNGSGGIGGTVIAKLIQNSIDKKLNPIEILSLDKVSFAFPVQKAGNLRMKAIRIRPEIGAGVVNIHIDYEFLKG